MVRARSIAAILISLTALIVACRGDEASTESPGAATNVAVPAPSLDGTGWVLESLAGSSVLPGTQITLSFDGDRASGFAGCNAYGGTALIDGGSLVLGEMAITAQACLDPQGVMEQEAAFVRALAEAVTYTMRGQRLELANEAGETTLAFARQVRYAMQPGDLLGIEWRLVSLEGGGTPVNLEGLTITLAFHTKNLVTGHAGCRDYVATYRADSDQLGFPSIAMIEAGCRLTEQVSDVEGRYTDALTWTTHFRLHEDRLEIETARGESLRFERVPASAPGALQAGSWLLTAFLDASQAEGMDVPAVVPSDVRPGTEITARFGDGLLKGSAGCNSYGSLYAVEGSSISIEVPEATEMFCADPEGIMEQERRYLASLPDLGSYTICGDHLLLQSAGGPSLLFRLQVTPQD